jgi:uncharacterized membrane protein HdeD (DUF308 family)
MIGMMNLGGIVAAERDELRKAWGWLVTLGVLFLILGLAALVFVGLTTLMTVLFVGWVFLIAGVAEAVHAIVRRGWSGFWVDLLSGVVTAVAGLLIVLHPGTGASVLTMFVAVVFLVGGLLRLGIGLGARTPYGGWFVLHGIVSAVLGVLILAEWPESAIWVIGTLVAIDLIVSGVRMISFGLAVRRFTSATDDRTPTPAPAPMG